MGTMEVGTGEGGLELVTLTAAGKSKAEIYSFGAHVVSWRSADGADRIYTSPTALYNGKKAIRGGIPVCFPQFGPRGPLKQHGFARSSVWELDVAAQDTSVPAASFTLSDSAETRASAWPHRFQARLTVRLAEDGNSLSVALAVRNVQEAPFSFTCALHSYFTCRSESIALADFDGVAYEDSIDESRNKKQVGDIAFGKEVDRVYTSTADSLSLGETGLTITKTNFPEAVVWNPHIEKTALLSDMPDDDWKKFICIEPGAIIEPVRLDAGSIWEGTVLLKVD